MANGNQPETLLEKFIRFWGGGSSRPKSNSRPQRLIPNESTVLEEIKLNRPNYHEDVTPISHCRPGKVHLHGMFTRTTSRRTRNGLHITEAIFSDETGSVRTVWFNRPYTASALKAGVIYDIRGDFKLSHSRFQIHNPEFKPLSEGCFSDEILKAKPEPEIPEIDEVDEINKLVEREVMGDEAQSLFNGPDVNNLGPIDGASNKRYTKQAYSLTKGAPKNWKITNIDLNGKRIDPDSFWGKLRIQVWSRDNYTCKDKNCDNEDLLTVHHVDPLSIGGTNELSNLITLCRKHHEQIHGRKIYNTKREFGDLDNYGKDYALSPKISKINNALNKHQDILIDYNDIKHIHTNRRITPIRLYIRNNKKYLEAYCHLRKAKRTFRVVRMQIR